MKKSKLFPLVEAAIMVALATALSLVRVYKLPLGGSITLLSMLPICLFSIRWGIGWGLGAGFVYALLQLFLDLAEVLSWGLTPLSLVGCFAFDYLIAFTVIGLAGIFRKSGKVGMLSGVVLALFLRFVCHIISGTFIFDIWLPEDWSNPFLYSLAYNGSFMLPELILTGIGAFFLCTPRLLKIGKQ